MKLIVSNGKHLEVRDVSDVIFRLTANSIPINKHGYFLLEDNEARDLLRELLNTNFYEGGKIDNNSRN